MIINKIEIKNFYSIREIKLNFENYKGIVLIEGKNKDNGGSNGSGKSSIIEAVVWGIFGRTIRKSTEEALINVYDNKNCSVTITVNNNIVIQRNKKPTSLKFFVGTEDKTQESALKTQELIEQTLNTNYKTFLASTVFGQHNNVDFIDATPEDKRLIIKNFLNLNEIFEKRESVKDLKSKFNTEIKTFDALLADNKNSLEKLVKNLLELENGEKKFLTENKITEDILEKYTLQDILDTELKIQKIQKKLDSLPSEMKNLTKSINEQKDRLEDKDNSCITCGQKNPLTREQKIKLFKKIEVDEEELKQKNNELLSLSKDKAKLNSNLPIRSSDYKIVTDWKHLKEKHQFFLDNKKDIEDKIDHLSGEKNKLYRNLEIMKFWEKAFSETGLIKYIIRNILGFLNGKTNYYLSYLSNGKFRIVFDEELNETIYTNGKELSFISLSGGEKRKISLAVMLGLQSLLSNTKREQTNIIFFDEVGENLDQEGLDGLYILLSELKKDKTLFIITHNNNLKNLIDNARVLTVTKHHGVSYLSRKNQ